VQIFGFIYLFIFFIFSFLFGLNVLGFEQVVAVVWSAWRQSWQTDSEFETYALLAAAVEALRAG
jgi:hypothetical protein